MPKNTNRVVRDMSRVVPAGASMHRIDSAWANRRAARSDSAPSSEAQAPASRSSRRVLELV